MNNFKQALQYIKSDLTRYNVKPTNFNIIKNVFFGIHAIKFTIWLRMCTFRNITFPFARFMHSYYRKKYGLQIPYTTKIGYGLYLGHSINVLIGTTAKIGNNCNISHMVTIGSNHDKYATIGDNVYIGPHTCIIEDVRIGNNAIIGAGAIVIKDIPENATVAGNPAKVVSMKNPGRFINNRYG